MQWYPYYMGFSADFAYSVLAEPKRSAEAVVLDPWNGSGTTTAMATKLGLSSCGFDLNPVAVLVAKARILNPLEKPSLRPLAAEIVETAASTRNELVELFPDPLANWFVPKSARALRRVEQTIYRLLIDESNYRPLTRNHSVDAISSLAAFFYTALFRTVRGLLSPFRPTNPTWLKVPNSPSSRLRPSHDRIASVFLSNVSAMISLLEGHGPNLNITTKPHAMLQTCSSEDLPIADRSIDLVVSSPPYCTRIDYAVATMGELAVLGYSPSPRLRRLRQKLIGTTTVNKNFRVIEIGWGDTCLKFLEAVRTHPTKASATYYYKTHLQYFQSIYRSLSELDRCLKHGAGLVLVIQDSYYKNLHNPLPDIFVEMATSKGFRLVEKFDFPVRRTQASLNPRVRPYRESTEAVESVITFERA